MVDITIVNGGYKATNTPWGVFIPIDFPSRMDMLWLAPHPLGVLFRP